jgi:hypothetical protein
MSRGEFGAGIPRHCSLFCATAMRRYHGIGAEDAMSDERVTLDLDLVGARLLAPTAAAGDLQQRVSVLETRFGVMETRIGGVEQRLDRMIALLLRLAERIRGAIAR